MQTVWLGRCADDSLEVRGLRRSLPPPSHGPPGATVQAVPRQAQQSAAPGSLDTLGKEAAVAETYLTTGNHLKVPFG